MNFISSTSGRACLSDWDQPIAVSDILQLLLAVKRAFTTAGGGVILVIVVRELVPMPANFLLTCLRGTLPAILHCCEQVAVVVEGASAGRDLLRAAFQPTRQDIARRAPPRDFESLNAALAHAQQFAPHDVLELQRYLLHRHFPPNGQWT